MTYTAPGLIVDRDVTRRSYAIAIGPCLEIPAGPSWPPGTWLHPAGCTRSPRFVDGPDGQAVLSEVRCARVDYLDAQAEPRAPLGVILTGRGWRAVERWTDAEGCTWWRYALRQEWVEDAAGNVLSGARREVLP